MTITALPTPPSRSDPLNFATRADAFLGQLPQFATEANALASQVNTNAGTASTAATSATNSANAAAESAVAAQVAASYKGEWSSLTGALTVPSTVSYNGRFYVLKEYIADVTAHTPGVSSVWLIQGLYENPVTISTNTNAAVFYFYKVTATCNVTLPSTPVDGQWIEFLNETGTGNFTILRNGKNIMSLSQDLLVDVEHKTFRLTFSGSDNTWLIKG